MVTVIIENAENGFVKTISDDNYNGAGQYFTKTSVTEIKEETKIRDSLKFISELVDDIGLDLGDKAGKETLALVNTWGPLYNPSNEELEAKIKELRNQAKRLSVIVKNRKEEII